MCKWCDETTGICVNAECQHCADFCPYVDEINYFCWWENGE